MKVVLALLFCLMVAGAYHFAQPAKSEDANDAKQTQRALRLMTWNIGYAELEDDTRAHTKDLPAVAEVILKSDPDAVALQELTGREQLNVLLRLLQNRYRGDVAQQGQSDRYEAVLVKDSEALFAAVRIGSLYAMGASFKPHADGPQVVVVSAHADAFNAARRRRYTEGLMDWAQSHTQASEVFIAGDFNFELSAVNETNLYTDNVKHDSESYSHILRSFRDLGREAGDTAINDRRIDYIFGPTRVQRAKRAEVLRNAAVGRMDHWPLVVEVGF
ncbi:MAG TPA: endonuclease/exonuclease/phosphatase family protein [Pyrinomonadaceae bacterium]|nr:endonuclease/exonuclease/phosphatase family protein [Pyrinomonadaceae bacterium]